MYAGNIILPGINPPTAVPLFQMKTAHCLCKKEIFLEKNDPNPKYPRYQGNSNNINNQKIAMSNGQVREKCHFAVIKEENTEKYK